MGWQDSLLRTGLQFTIIRPQLHILKGEFRIINSALLDLVQMEITLTISHTKKEF